MGIAPVLSLGSGVGMTVRGKLSVWPSFPVSIMQVDSNIDSSKETLAGHSPNWTGLPSHSRERSAVEMLIYV